METTEAIATVIAAAPKKPTWVSGSAVGFYGMRKDDVVVDEQGAGERRPRSGLPRVGSGDRAGPAGGGARRSRADRDRARPGRRGAGEDAPAFKAFAGGPLGDGAQWLSWVHLEDAVRALLFAVDNASIEGPFNVTAPKPVTMNTFARTLAHAVHRPCLMRVPGVALKIALGDGLAETLLNGQRAVPAKLERQGFAFRFQELEGALRDLLGG